MPTFDTPITTDERSLKKVLGQKEPVLLFLYDGSQTNKPLDDALQRAAKKHAGELLVVKVDAAQNPGIAKQYGSPQLPAVVTLTKALLGRKIKSCGEFVRPNDVRGHIDFLLNDTPLVSEKTANDPASAENGKKPLAVTDMTFRKEVLKSKLPVLVDFWAVWCGPCQTISPFVSQMAQKYSGKVRVVKLNVDESPVTARQFGVQSIPTFILFENGQAVSRFAGANPRGIQQMIDEAVGN